MSITLQRIGAEIALRAIHAELDGKEWNSDTLEAIAVHIRSCGFKISGPDGEDESVDADDHGLGCDGPLNCTCGRKGHNAVDDPGHRRRGKFLLMVAAGRWHGRTPIAAEVARVLVRAFWPDETAPTSADVDRFLEDLRSDSRECLATSYFDLFYERERT